MTFFRWIAAGLLLVSAVGTTAFVVNPTTGGGGLPSGTIVLVASGSCPAGTSEVAGLSGKMLLGTVAANGDIGATGGSDNVTPTGNVAAPAFTGNTGTVPAQTISYPVNVPTFSGNSGTVPAHTISWPAGVPTFAGNSFSSVINHTHTVTVTWNVQGGTTASTTGTHVMTSTSTGGSARAPASGDVVSASTANPGGGVSSITPAGTVAWPAEVPTENTVSFTPAGTVAWPVNPPTNGTVSFTPAGTNSAPAFTGNSFDNRSAYVKVIFCQAA